MKKFDRKTANRLVSSGTPDSIRRYCAEFAEKGDPDAQAVLDIFFGGSLCKDEKKVVEWLELAAKKGRTEAQYALGIRCLNGIGVPADKDKAVELLKAAAEKGYDKAREELEKLGLAKKPNIIVLTKGQYQKKVAYMNVMDNIFSAQAGAEELEAAAKNHDPSALFKLGIMYLLGVDVRVKQDKAKAVGYIEEAERLGAKGAAYVFHNKIPLEDEKLRLAIAEIQCELGVCYFDGTTDKNMGKALKLIKMSVDNGHPEAEYNLGLCYLGGTEEDKKKAFGCFEKAAESDERAKNSLGVCFKNGIGTDRNEDKAVKLFKEAADLGYAEAQFNYAYCRYMGIGSQERNEEEAGEYFRLSADKIAGSQFFVGGYFYHGLGGMEKDREKAVEYYKKAAKGNFAFAQYILGMLYEQGETVEKNEDEALKYYAAAAENGIDIAQDRLGKFYVKKRETQNAIKWFTAAAKRGRAVFQYDLLAYREQYADVSAEDDFDAFKALEKAAEQGNAEAENYLGMCYEKGVGTKRNLQEAFRLYNSSTAANDPKGQYNLARCYDDNSELSADVSFFLSIDADSQKAAELYEKAAESDCTEAQFEYGRCLEYGIGREPNDKTAMEFYYLAAENGHKMARRHYERLKAHNVTIEEKDLALEKEKREKSELDRALRDHIEKESSDKRDKLDEAKNKLIDILGKANWELMLDDTKKALTTAQYEWDNCKGLPNYEYSGIVINMNTALESELCRWFFVGFQNYMRNYMKNYLKKRRENCEEWPVILTYKGYRKRTAFKPERFVMGMTAEIFGKEPHSDDPSYNEKHGDLANLAKWRKLYLKAITKGNSKDPTLLFTGGEPNGRAFCSAGSILGRIEYIREKRNRAAHKSTVTKEVCEEYYDIIIGKKQGEGSSLFRELFSLLRKSEYTSPDKFAKRS